MPVSATPPQFIQELWSGQLAPKLHLSREALFESVSDGITTDVHFISLPEGRFVLRFYPPDSASRLNGYRSARKVFEGLGFRVPAEVGCGEVAEGSWLLEERIVGASFRDLLGDGNAVSKAAQSLAGLHSNENRRYGEVGGLGGRRLSLRWSQRFPERWRKIEKLFPELRPVAPEVEAWFQGWADAYSPSAYQLLHGDYHPGNLAVTEQGEITFLDLRSPKYGFGLVEAVEAAHHFTGEQPADWEPFLGPYLSARDSGTRDLYAHFATALHAVFHLRHADRFSDLAVGRRGTLTDHRRWERNALDSWLRFCDLAGIVSPRVEGTPESAFPPRGLIPPPGGR